MQELYYIIKNWKLIVIGGGGFFLLFIILLCCSSSGGSEEGVASSYFTTPFPTETKFHITSHYGTRIDPIVDNTISFHSGIDLSASAGTDIVASGDGIIHKVGYDANGLGNYVYIKHDLGGLIFYTIYGHMLDDSIVVKENDSIKAKDKIGTIGSTGRSTGTHLHFMISKNKISYKEEDLINPYDVVIGLQEGWFIKKCKITEKDFRILINGESIAYHIYDTMFNENKKHEYVDCIANSYVTDFDIFSKEAIETFARASYVLAKDYGIDMMSLPFKSDVIKDAVNEYILNNNNKDKEYSIDI